MKEKEEDEERNENICPQTDTQVNTQRIQKLRSTLILCGSSGERANFMKFIWKTYLIPIIDYCSQLYGPNSGSGLLKLENLQKAFTSKISGIGHLSYWERLKKLKIYSITR